MRKKIFLVFDTTKQMHRTEKDSPYYLTSNVSPACVTIVLVRSLWCPVLRDENNDGNSVTVNVCMYTIYYYFLLSLLSVLLTPAASMAAVVVVYACSFLFESSDALVRFLLNMLFLHDDNGTHTIKKACQSPLHRP
jgi:hypothetical protein